MKCFYHSADLDGHCSGAIIKQKYPECEMIGINYGDEFPWGDIKEGEVVYMVDFCLQPFVDMDRLNSLCNLHWIDHHITAIEESRHPQFLASGGQFLDIGRAGCELTWAYVHGSSKPYEIPWPIYLLGRYDVWDHSDTEVLPFQYGMRQIEDTLPDNQEMWQKLFRGETDYLDIVTQGKLILAYEKSQNAKFCNAYAFETSLNGFTAICVNRGFINSKVFDSVFDPAIHALMITFVRMKLPARTWRVSVYAETDDIDCSAIAKVYGGGGHKNAAGFQCVDLPFSI